MFFISPSNTLHKKYDIITDNNKVIHIGDTRYEDYTIHNDPKRKALYLGRHEHNEDWNNLSSAGAWSRWLLWNKPTLLSSIQDMEKRFNINITPLHF